VEPEEKPKKKAPAKKPASKKEPAAPKAKPESKRKPAAKKVGIWSMFLFTMLTICACSGCC
jgi:hypothetical protein